MTTATRMIAPTAVVPTLFVAFDLGETSWKLAFASGFGQRARLRTVAARDVAAVRREIAQAKERLGLVAGSPVQSCDEAGREGFWLHRWLGAASVEVNRRLRRAKTDRMDATLQGVGSKSAWLYVMEFFGWRHFRNRREVGALAGLTPTPYQSGESHCEQGIAKAGNRHVRAMAIEIAWGWLRFQPASALTQWYEQRFGHGSSRLRRIGIVALPRRLLITLALRRGRSSARGCAARAGPESSLDGSEGGRSREWVRRARCAAWFACRIDRWMGGSRHEALQSPVGEQRIR